MAMTGLIDEIMLNGLCLEENLYLILIILLYVENSRKLHLSSIHENEKEPC